MYKPEGVKVLVKPERVEEKTKGGIFLPQQSRDSEQTRVTRGEIVAMGPDAAVRFADDRSAQVGDMVVFSKYGGFSLDDDEYRILNDEDIIALIEKE